MLDDNRYEEPPEKPRPQNDPPAKTVGAPSHYAEAEEVPEWLAGVAKIVGGGYLFLGLFFSLGCGALCCIIGLFI
jgi:hypothetical protein